MSKQNVQAFFDKVDQDPELQRKVQDIPQPLDQTSAQQVSELANGVGIAISAEDILAVASESELAESELENVSGGVVTTPPAEKSWWKKIFG